MSKAPSPFRYFHSSPYLIRLVVMQYVRFPLSLHHVEDLLHERDRPVPRDVAAVVLGWPRSSGASHAVAAHFNSTETELMGIYSVHLVGESNYQAAIRGLAQGDEALLVPESDSPHDPRAIRVDRVDGLTIGHLDRDSWVTRVILDDGTEVSAVIEEIFGDNSDKCSLGVVLEVRTGHDANTPGVRPIVDTASPTDPPSALHHVEKPKGAFSQSGCILFVLGLGALIAIGIGVLKKDEPTTEGTNAESKIGSD